MEVRNVSVDIDVDTTRHSIIIPTTFIPEDRVAADVFPSEILEVDACFRIGRIARACTQSYVVLRLVGQDVDLVVDEGIT